MGSEGSSVGGGGGGGGVWKVGVQKSKKIKFLKIQIRSAQNVGKVWISRKKSSRPYLGPFEAMFSMDRKNQKKIKILKIEIRSAQNVGKVWISRKKSSRPYLGPSQAIFSVDRKNQKNNKICLFSLVGQWALLTQCGPLLLSTRGGAIGRTRI